MKYLRFDLVTVLKSRLEFMEHYSNQGVVPGELDSIELEQLKEHIEEIKYVLSILMNAARNDAKLVPQNQKYVS